LAFRGEGNTYTHGTQGHHPGQGAGPRRSDAPAQPAHDRRRGQRPHRRRPIRRGQRVHDPGNHDGLNRRYLDHLNLVLDVHEHLIGAAIVDHAGHQLFQLWSGCLGRILIA
jgi:hypothetical protein